MADSVEPIVLATKAAEPAAQATPAEPAAAADAATPAKPVADATAKSSGFLRQIMAIKRQSSDPKMPKPAGAAGQRPPPRIRATPDEVSKVENNLTTSAVRPERPLTPKLKAAAATGARRLLGLAMKGSGKAPAAGVAGASGLWKRSMRTSVLGRTAVRPALVPARDPAPEARRVVVKQRVPPVLRVQQDTPRRAIAARPDMHRDVGRVLAAALVGAAGRANRGVAGRRPGLLRPAVQTAIIRTPMRSGVKFRGVAGALLPVKKEEGASDNETHRRPQRVITKATPGRRMELRSAASLAARSRPALTAARRPVAALQIVPRAGFGYGAAGESDESNDDSERRDAVANGKRKRPLTAAAPGKAPIKRGLNMAVGLMQRHLGAARRQLSDERTGIKVKEEARWEPEDSPARPAHKDDASQGVSQEASQSPPRKRAKQVESKLSAAESKRQREEEDAKAEAKEMQSLQRRLEAHYGSMKNFIRTRAEPTIFYLPAKHNSESKRELEETRAAISQKIASLKVHLQTVPADDDEDSEA